MLKRVCFVLAVLMVHSSAMACFLAFPLNAQERLPGDLDGNGEVNFADYLIFAQNFGRTGGQTFDPNQYVDTIVVTVRDTLWRDSPVEPLPRPEIFVRHIDWIFYPTRDNYASGAAIIKRLLTITRDVFAKYLMYPLDSDIIVDRSFRTFNGFPLPSPYVAYQRASSGAYQVYLVPALPIDLIFQFAHEYGHILSNYREPPFNDWRYRQHKWFDESIAHLATLFALKMLGEELQQEKYQDLSHYNYGERALREFNHRKEALSRRGIDVPQNFSDFRNWYRQHKTELENNSTLREKNEVVSFMLFDLFERYPDEAWNAVRYMNRGSLRSVENFSTYLNNWYRYTPTQWQFIVDRIMTRFGVGHIAGPFLTDSPIGIK